MNRVVVVVVVVRDPQSSLTFSTFSFRTILEPSLTLACYNITCYTRV